MITCRICSCTDTDCSWCIVLQGYPCMWREDDLCSACEELATTDVERARIRGQKFIKMAERRSGRAPGFMQQATHGRECLRVAVRIECQERRASA